MIAERDHLKKSLYDWVDAVVKESGRNDQVVWRPNSGPRPGEPFVALEQIGGSHSGHPWKSMVKLNDPDGTAGSQDIVQAVRRTFSLYGFGERSIDLLEYIRDSIYREYWINFLARRSIVISEAMEVKDISVEIDNVLEVQASFDFVVTFNRLIKDNPGWIEHLTIRPDDGLPISPISI